MSYLESMAGKLPLSILDRFASEYETRACFNHVTVLRKVNLHTKSYEGAAELG
jgi:hypothetical protein